MADIWFELSIASMLYKVASSINSVRPFFFWLIAFIALVFSTFILATLGMIYIQRGLMFLFKLGSRSF